MKNTQLPAHARVVKAHGAGNSFVVATDQYDDYDPSEVEVATLCSPAFGIGADGFIRAVERDGLWFMDYRNADGSKAEMCGNGVRVFVDHLRREGLVDLPVGQTLDVATRGGIKRVTPESEDEGQGASYRVDMGPAASPARETIEVRVSGIDAVLGGIWVDMPNPHTVVELADEETLRGVFLPTVDVSQIPQAQRPFYDPAPQAGTNLELVVDLTEPGAERGRCACSNEAWGRPRRAAPGAALQPSPPRCDAAPARPPSGSSIFRAAGSLSASTASSTGRGRAPASRTRRCSSPDPRPESPRSACPEPAPRKGAGKRDEAPASSMRTSSSGGSDLDDSEALLGRVL